MKSQYFCAGHAEQVCGSEPWALNHWHEVMRRGVKAYVECRVEAAMLFLNSAFDIAQLRSECSHNRHFGVMHLCKPLEFIIQLLLVDEREQNAQQLLERLGALDVQSLQGGGVVLADFLAMQHTLINIPLKKVLHSRPKDTSHTTTRLLAARCGVASTAHTGLVH